MLPIVILVWSYRESDLRLFSALLIAITPWMFTLDCVNYAGWLPMSVHDTEIFCSPPATSHGSNKLSPYLREEVVKRMMIHVTDAAEKDIKSVMVPTRYTAVVVLALTALTRSL